MSQAGLSQPHPLQTPYPSLARMPLQSWIKASKAFFDRLLWIMKKATSVLPMTHNHLSTPLHRQDVSSTWLTGASLARSRRWIRSVRLLRNSHELLLSRFSGSCDGSRGRFFSSPRMFSSPWRQFPAKGDSFPQQPTLRTAFFRLKALALRRNSSSTLARPRYRARKNP